LTDIKPFVSSSIYSLTMLQPNFVEKIKDEQILEMVRSPGTMELGYKMIFDIYKEELYGYIRKIVITHENADDVLQNTLIKVFQNIAGFRGESSLKSWIYSIAHRESLQLLRRNKRQATTRSEEITDRPELFSDPYFRGEKVHQLLLEAVASLPERQKQVFELKYFEDFKYSEIAEILELTEGGLKSSYHHAVKKIKEFVRSNTFL